MKRRTATLLRTTLAIFFIGALTLASLWILEPFPAR